MWQLLEKKHGTVPHNLKSISDSTFFYFVQSYASHTYAYVFVFANRDNHLGTDGFHITTGLNDAQKYMYTSTKTSQ